MRKFLGVLCMLLGLCMLLYAGFLLYSDRAAEKTAGEQAALMLLQLKEKTELTVTAAPVATPAVTPVATPRATIRATAAATETAGPTVDPIPEAPAYAGDREMPVTELDGEAYIGYLELPTLGLSLPVMSEWSYPRLQVAPCRYYGSVYDDSLVLLAHNYKRHFGDIKNLHEGDPVQFIDAEGNIYRYVVVGQERLTREERQRLLSHDSDLSLVTCTYGGSYRVVVRLDRVLGY